MEEDEIRYVVAQLLNFIRFNVDSLSFKGHEFLDNIKDDTVWKKAKKFVGEHLTSTSFSIIANVASKIAILYITKESVSNTLFLLICNYSRLSMISNISTSSKLKNSINSLNAS